MVPIIEILTKPNTRVLKIKIPIKKTKIIYLPVQNNLKKNVFTK